MLAFRARLTLSIQLNLSHHLIRQVLEIKHLGGLYDPFLTCRPHKEHITAHGTRALGPLDSFSLPRHTFDTHILCPALTCVWMCAVLWYANIEYYFSVSCGMA